ncbi:hypothetical protein [Acaryochloris marina]|uniref:Uncharacterized protein n=1 Tax=Acaryochloris marina (strain MBIC 11017) TaxID=329726 RepID=A8ZNA0_ACAM1|nr:hypothetical protein [Acaryochloris marina]ABW32299.1 hypothetical protein AM1_C0372 [Acaryochloris marina MBIC11017]
MTNATDLTQTLGIEQNDLDKLLRACGMSEDGYDLETLQGVLQLKAENNADTYTHGWCIYTSEMYQVDLKPIHKAISAEGIETGDDLYHPLFILVCERVSEEGVDPVDAVKAEMRGVEEVPLVESAIPRAELPEVLKRKIDPIIDLATENTIHQVVQVLGELDESANRYVNARIQAKADEIMQRPEVAALVSKLTANQLTPGKQPLLKATVVEE